MGSQTNTEIDPIGYLVAPLVPPTLNIIFAPTLAAMAGHAEQIGPSIGWMVIAWFGLEAICLATIYPLLWMAGRFIMALNIPAKASAVAAVILSAVSSYMLLGTQSVDHAVSLSWLAAALASSFAFIAYQGRSIFFEKGVAQR